MLDFAQRSCTVSKEARRATRTHGDATVLDPTSPDELYPIEDLSVVGLSARSNPPWDIGHVLDVILQCEDLQVSVKTQVVRRTTDLVALEILNRTPEQDRQIFDLMLSMVRGGGELSEQRRAPRLEVRGHATWSEDVLMQPVKLSNLSRTGAVLHGSRVPEIGAQGIIRLQVPGDTPQCEARVSRKVEDGGFAVEFLAPTEAFRLVVSHIRVSYSRD